MSTPRHLLVASAAALALGGVAAACDDETTDDLQEDVEDVRDDVESAVTDAVDAIDEASEDAVEAAARSFAALQGEQEFEAAGHEIDGDLTCEADATDDLTAVEITCTGTTVDGGDARLTGTTTELPGVSIDQLDGDFVGTVDGDEVFTTDGLGG